MPDSANSYAFYADYSQMAACLFAIQAMDDNGDFSSEEEIKLLLNSFQNDVLQKLYNRTLMVLGIIDGNITVTEEYLKGDFDEYDFTIFDFHTGYLDTRNTGYSSRFQTILNIFAEFSRRLFRITPDLGSAIDDALIPVLDAFEELQDYLNAAGLNPCTGSTTQMAYYNNSSELYLQAAGSDGIDGTVAGIHLRWGLIGDLGDNHLPKGNYASTTTGYNKPNDYIQLERTPYINPIRAVLDFAQAKPVVSYENKRWTYVVNVIVNETVYSTRVRLNFKDAGLYDQLAVTIDASAASSDFLKAYTGVIELDFSNKSIFVFTTDFRKNSTVNSAELKVEAISSLEDEMTGIRDTITANVAVPVKTNTYWGDNIRKVRFKTNGGYLNSISFETYHDFISSRDSSAWIEIGADFAISLDDQIVYNRLETPEKLIDNLWPHYNEGAKVRTQNYRDKWSVTWDIVDIALKNTVEEYIALSDTDPRAMGNLQEEDNIEIEIPFSYLDVVNLQALDYHIARMLGLGHIDNLAAQPAEKFVYGIRYTNRKSIGSSEMVTYRYLSLPTSKTDNRLPAKPLIRPLEYALPGTLKDSPLFDENGYSRRDNVRVVNIGREHWSFEKTDIDFFAQGTTDRFNIFEQSKPILYGVEYRPADEDHYVKPEITTQNSQGHIYYDYDAEYPGTGIPETDPVPDNEESLYVHLEEQPGIHVYAIYGINLFSRASVLSDEAATDVTEFPKINTLKAPADLAVQYIQKEDTLLFTTQTEQDWLAGRRNTFPGRDTDYTRICFNWLDITDLSHMPASEPFLPSDYVKANRVNVFFRPGPPEEIMGIISRIKPVPGMDNQLLLYTDGYAALNGITVTPVTDGSAMRKFTDSILTTEEGQFRVLSVTAGVKPVITIEKTLETENIENPDQPGDFANNQYYKVPSAGSRFSMVENLGNPANWQSLVKKIDLVDLSDPENPVTEIETDSEGGEFRYLIGGITADALVEPLLDTDDQVIAGFYKVRYTGITLPPNPQVNLPYDPAHPEANSPETLQAPHVEWYKGLIRLPLADDSEKELVEVSRIIQTDPLELYVYYPAYETEPIKVSENEMDTVSGVNFHPGYRAYVFTEPQPQTFNRSSIYPGDNENDKKTLLALQTADTRPGGSGFTSTISEPAILLALRIVEPVPPERPTYFGLKVRPDAVGKAAFTFDTKIAPNSNGTARNPFGLYFYRMSNEDLLYALYNPETVIGILNDLAALTDDPFFSQRFVELADLVFDPANPGHFKVYEAEPEPYGFPVPDKTDLVLPGDIPEEKYAQAIRSVLLPLTEQLPMFTFIKQGKQTENKQPVIRDINGNLLSPTSTLFNPFPMIRKFPSESAANTTYVRFTDYTLNGSSRFLYFYAAAETTDKLVVGPLSGFAGPVEILQTLPADAPIIRSFAYHPAGLAGEEASVLFRLEAVSESDNLSKVRMYRSLDLDTTLSLQGIGSYLEVPLPAVEDEMEVSDDFSDMAEIPFGETLYYRLAYVRTIVNEDDELEDILSYGSEVIAVKLIDSVNPQAPELTYDPVHNKLMWEPTVYSGIYYLYRQNNRGNWEKLTDISRRADEGAMEYIFPDPLPSTDEDGDPLYHRFKVKVENASGLMNLIDEELTI